MAEEPLGGTQAAAMSNGEVLLVGGNAAALAPGQGRVIARVDPDILVLQAGIHALPELARRAPYAIIRWPDGKLETFGDETALQQLDQGARLYVAAWREQALSKKDRRGQGQAWDAPGFQPPDLPGR